MHETSEDSVLDRAICDSIDPGLKASLRREQSERRRRFTLYGGVVLSTLLVATIGILFSAGVLNAGDKDAVDRAVASEELAARGYKLWQSGALAEAQKKFEKAVKQDPQNSQAWNGLGWTLVNQGQVQKAKDAFQKCVDLNPKHFAALNGLGQISLSSRQYVEAEEYFLRAENASAAWYGLLRIYLLQEKFEEGQKYLEKIEATGQTQAIAGLDLIRKSIADKQLSDELRVLIEPPAPPSDDASAMELNQQGWVLMNKGQMRAAQVAFESALESDPEMAVAKNGLGFALLNQGKYSEARKLFEEILAVEENALGAMNGLARCLRAEKETEKAIELFVKVDQATPVINAGTMALADIYVSDEDWKAALPYLERIAKAQPTNKLIQQQLKTAKSKLSAEKSGD